MGRPRYAKKDRNQSEIVEVLEAKGFLCLDVSQLAHLGFDLLVCASHRRWLIPMWLAVEVKAPGGTLTEREAEFQAEMQYRFGDECPAIVATSAEQVLDWFHARG